MDLKSILAMGAEISCGSVIHQGKLLGVPRIGGEVDLTPEGVEFVERVKESDGLLAQPAAEAPKAAPRKRATKAKEDAPAEISPVPASDDDGVGSLSDD